MPKEMPDDDSLLDAATTSSQARQKGRSNKVSPEQKGRIAFMSGCCLLLLPFMVAGIVYYARTSETPRKKDFDTAQGLLITSVFLSLCCFCSGLGYNYAVSHDVSWEKLRSEAENPVKSKKDTRRGRDKAAAAAFVFVPCTLVIVSTALLGTLSRSYYPALTSVLVCQGDEALVPSFSDSRVCPYWGGKRPLPEPYLRKCPQYWGLSCCTPQEAESLFELNSWLDAVSGDKYNQGDCHEVLESLMCWACSPDQNMFYAEGRVKVCPRMCDTVYDVCSESVFEYGERTFSEVFSDGQQMCSYLQFDVSSDCSCHEIYPKNDHITFSGITIGSDTSAGAATTVAASNTRETL